MNTESPAADTVDSSHAKDAARFGGHSRLVSRAGRGVVVQVTRILNWQVGCVPLTLSVLRREEGAGDRGPK